MKGTSKNPFERKRCIRADQLSYSVYYFYCYYCCCNFTYYYFVLLLLYKYSSIRSGPASAFQEGWREGVWGREEGKLISTLEMGFPFSFPQPQASATVLKRQRLFSSVSDSSQSANSFSAKSSSTLPALSMLPESPSCAKAGLIGICATFLIPSLEAVSSIWLLP